MRVKGTPNVRRRPIARGALGTLVGRRMDACAPLRQSRAPLRHSCGGRNPGDLWGSRALPMFDGARSRAARWGLWWAVGWMSAPLSVSPAPLSVVPAPPPSFLRRQESRRSVRVKGTPNVRRRPIARGALGDLVGRRADGGSSHGWVVAWIPASAGMTEGVGVTDRGGCDGQGGCDGRGGCDGQGRV